MTYRPPGRSHRAGRAQADNDVFEGLPVKQWGQSITHISLAPPRSETATANENDKWDIDPPMPRDFQLLQPWTQQLLRLARSAKVGNKRKSDPDGMDDEKPEDDQGGEDGAAGGGKANLEDRGYVAKKWKPVPEALLEPEHKHFEFLAKRRKGLPSLYAPELNNGPVVPMRKTKVQKTGPDGEITIYEVLVPEGQTVEGEVTSTTELADIKPVVAAPGTVIEGVGIANDEGVVVAEHLRPPVAPRRNRPPPKKKGGPGRGKKRVTFINADGSTITKIVPNATKIVPAPGQIVTHVAKGEEAKADITAEQAAANAAAQQHTEGEDGDGGDDGDDGEGEGSDEEGDEGDDDDDREEGEVSEDAPSAGNTPIPSRKTPTAEGSSLKIEDTAMTDAPATAPPTITSPQPELAHPSPSKSKARSASSSPDLPLAKSSHSRTNSLLSPSAAAAAVREIAESIPPAVEDSVPQVPVLPEAAAVASPIAEIDEAAVAATGPEEDEAVQKLPDREGDLPGMLDKGVDGDEGEGGAEGEGQGEEAAA